MRDDLARVVNILWWAVVRTRVFLVDAADGPAVGEVHGRVFGAVRPASGFIVVSGFLDPRWKVEIEADAIVSST